MTLDEIRHQLATARDIPQEALTSAVEQAEALAPAVEGSEEEIEPLDGDARRTVVGNLPQLVRMVYAFWNGLPVLPLVEPERSQKIGRNEPCPCGSGRKHKKCCGANAQI